jgi:hypothetical protein
MLKGAGRVSRPRAHDEYAIPPGINSTNQAGSFRGVWQQCWTSCERTRLWRIEATSLVRGADVSSESEDSNLTDWSVVSEFA